MDAAESGNGMGRKLEEMANPKPSPAEQGETVSGQKQTAAQIAARFGIKTGATIEVVEPRMDAESGFIPGSLGPDAGQQPVVGASEEQTSEQVEIAQIGKFKAEFGVEATKRMLQQRGQMRRQGIKTWGQVFEMARADKERNEGNA